MIVPVAIVQFGCCVTVAVGCAGVVGCAVIVTFNAGDTQPSLFLKLTLYLLGARLLKTPVVFV